jgi:UDP-glucose 4-epimerase
MLRLGCHGRRRNNAHDQKKDCACYRFKRLRWSALSQYLLARGHVVIASSRKPFTPSGPNMEFLQVPDLRFGFDWQPIISSCDSIGHLAGVAHRLAQPHAYDLINVQATASIARAASECGIRQFVFVSSIAAQVGPFSEAHLSEEEPPHPTMHMDAPS